MDVEEQRTRGTGGSRNFGDFAEELKNVMIITAGGE
jgi:hypothetical protein